MRAITRDSYGGPEVLQLQELPALQPGPGEVLVEVMAASLNAADVHLLRGEPWPARLAFGLRRPKRRGLGADVAGRVIGLGAGVTAFRPGDAVFGDLSGSGFGAFAEQVVAPAKAFAKMQPNVTFEQAAATPLAAVTALQALRDKCRVAAGERVLVTGASGGVGSFAVQIAKALGATVTAVTRGANVEHVRALGADQVIDRETEEFRDGAGSYDAIVDTAGYGDVRATQKLLVEGGRYVFVGGGNKETLSALLRGKSMLATPNPADLREVARLLETELIRPLIGDTLPLEQVPEAVRRFEAGQVVGKLVVSVRPPTSPDDAGPGRDLDA